MKISSLILLLTVCISSMGQYTVKEEDFSHVAQEEWVDLDDQAILDQFPSLGHYELRNYQLGYLIPDSSNLGSLLAYGFLEIPYMECGTIEDVMDTQLEALTSAGLTVDPVVNKDHFYFYTPITVDSQKKFMGYVLGNTGILFVIYVPMGKPDMKLFTNVLESVDMYLPYTNSGKCQDEEQAEELRNEANKYALIGCIFLAVSLVGSYIRKKMKS